jgi:hypothetical protein
MLCEARKCERLPTVVDKQLIKVVARQHTHVAALQLPCADSLASGLTDAV